MKRQKSVVQGRATDEHISETFMNPVGKLAQKVKALKKLVILPIHERRSKAMCASFSFFTIIENPLEIKNI